jgi:hypothetical protein
MFPGPGGSEVALEAFLSYTHEGQKVGRVTESGRDLVQLEAVIPKEGTNHGGPRTYWFDPKMNFLQRKVVLTYEYLKQPMRMECEVIDFAEPRPGIFFPIRQVTHIYAKEKLFQTQTMNISHIRVNERIPRDVFQLQFPEGCLVRDNLDQKTYRINGQGRPDQIVHNFGPNAHASDQSKLPPPSGFSTQSESERQSWLTWVIWGSMLTLGVCGLALLFRWRRSANT